MPTQEGSRKAVVSQFFAKPSSSPSKGGGVAASQSRNGLKKQTSIISLSSSDDIGDNDDIEVIETAPAVVSAASSSSARKRKASPINDDSSKKSNKIGTTGDTASKKIKVAPLFERVKNAGSTSSFSVKKEEDAGTVQRLQQWKFAATGTNGDAHGTPFPVAGNSARDALHSSSPLPEVAKSNDAVQARRAQVRKMLLGIDTEWRRPPDDDAEADATPAEDAEDVVADSMMEDEPIASTSALPVNGKAKRKGKSTEVDDADEGNAPDLSKFASTKADSKTKKTKATASDKKGKGKAVKPAVKYTPLEQQVLDIKKKYPDTLLIVEVGYKFKFFGEDAKIAAKELNIACFMSQNFYTAMIPEHRLQVHVKRLIASGHKVGIVRQKETAALKKIGDNRNAPFTRELTDLYTAATYIGGLDDDKLSENTPTFGTLLCLCEESIGGKGSDEKVRFGLVSAQPSTGEVIYDEFEDGFLRAELETRLLHIQPGELVLQGSISAPTNRVIAYLVSQESMSTNQGQGRITESRLRLSQTDAIAALTTFYGKVTREKAPSPRKKSKSTTTPGDQTDDVIDLSDSESIGGGGEVLASVLGLPPRVIVALAGLIQHFTEFRLESVFRRPQYFTPFAQRGHMLLNSNTIANLEIFRNQTDYKQTGSLFSILDHTKTAFGQRLLRRWVAMPLLQRAALQVRIDAVEEILESRSYLLGKLRGLLNGLPDLERGLARIHYGKSTPQELLRVLSAFQRIGDEFQGLPKDLSQSTVGFKSPMINDAFYALPRIKPLVQKFLSMINASKAKEGAKADMWMPEHQSEEITDCKDVLDTVEAEFQIHLRECRKLLRKPALEYITVAQDEYLLEMRISDSSVVPDDWVRINGTKTVYRYRSPRMQTLLQERDQATEWLAAEADYAFSQLLSSISEQYEGFRDIVVHLATLDSLISLATVGLNPGFVKPTLVDTPCLSIVAGRHPIVETVTERPFIPNDVAFSPDKLRAIVITGCNMSGKSSYSRMVALLVIMTQIGCRIPCSSARIGVVDYIGTRFGANDEIARGRSTFMVELTETCEIIKAATPRSLVVLDELGRGTSTNDGLAIAHAVLQFLVTRIKCSTLFITHFPQLAEIAQKYPGQCGMFQMAYREETGIDRVPDITFLYKLVPGVTDRVHGVACARMAGVPESVCLVAANKSEELENSDTRVQERKKEGRARYLLRLLSHQNAVSDSQVVQAARKAIVA